MFKRALVIGINNYPVSPLEGCENDAQSIAELLSRNEDGSNNFSVLLDKNIKTRTELITKISKLFDGEADVDAALLYFSGHGLVTSLGGCLITPDVKSHSDGLSMDDILKIAINSRIRSKIIILDCCYAGGMGDNYNSVNPTSTLCDGMIILTACSRRETAKEIGEHGLFTSLLINALRGGASDILGNISPGSIYGYIDNALGAWDQRPIFKACVSKFISLRNTGAQIDIMILKKITEYFKNPEMIYPLDYSYEFTNPNASLTNVAIFKHLQTMETIGFIKPYKEEHLFFAAQNNTGCYLTPYGQTYWWMLKKGRI